MRRITHPLLHLLPIPTHHLQHAAHCLAVRRDPHTPTQQYVRESALHTKGNAHVLLHPFNSKYPFTNVYADGHNIAPGALSPTQLTMRILRNLCSIDTTTATDKSQSTHFHLETFLPPRRPYLDKPRSILQIHL